MKISVLHSTEAISAYITEKINLLLSENDEGISIAISGGNTPKALFQYWREHKTEIEWQRITFYWVDERCVPSSSLESNYGEAKRIFFDHVQDFNIRKCFIRGENNAEDEVAFLNKKVLLSQKNKMPEFDLVLLGLGNDGHTASIFPNQMQLLTDKRIYVTAVHPETNQQRISLSGTVINNARNVCFVVTGADKRLILKTIIQKKDNWESYPASYINPSKGNLEWIVNDAAMSDFNV